MRQSVARVVVAALTALLCVVATYGSALAQVAEAKGSPSPQDIEEAKQHMAAGVAFMQDPDGARYEEAYPEFRRAYEKSGSLNALHNLAICAQKLELDGEAIAYYQRVLDQKGDDLDPNDKEQITRDLSALQAVVAWVTFSSDKGQVTLIDERTPNQGPIVRNRYDIGMQPKKFGLHPGNHKLTAKVDGQPDQVRSVEIPNGGQLNIEFVFDKNAPVTADGFTDEDMKGMTVGQTDVSPDEGGGLHWSVWVAGGVTIAAAIPMAIFMGMSASKKSEYDDEILGKAPQAEQQEAADSLKTTNLLADVFLGVTAAGAVTTIILAIVLSGGDDETASSDGPRFGVDYTLQPMVDHRGSAGAVLTTTF